MQGAHIDPAARTSQGSDRAFLLRFAPLCGAAIFVGTTVGGLELSRATSILYVIPIGLIAVEFGLVGGLIAAAAGTAALLASVGFGSVPEIGPEGLTARLVAFFATGALTGALADAVRAHTHYLQLLNERLEVIANLDELTGVANRRAFRKHLCRHLEQARSRGWRGAILAIDVDRLKTVNDQLGHDAGDQLLIDIADRLRSNLRRGDVIARLGGDEFAVLLKGSDRQTAEGIASKLTRALAGTNVVVENSVAQVGTASIGIALIEGPVDPDGVMREADSALYEAKRQGGKCVVSAANR